MRVGKTFEMPKTRVDVAISVLEKLQETFQNREFTRDEMMQALGVGPNNGSFNAKARDLPSYKLLKYANNHFTISDFGYRVLQNPVSLELKEEMVRNIKLWVYFLDKYPDKLNEDAFRTELKAATHVTNDFLEKHGHQVFKNYEAVFKLLKPSASPVESPRPTVSQQPKPTPSTTQTVIQAQKSPAQDKCPYGIYYQGKMLYAKDEEAFDLLSDLIHEKRSRERGGK